MGLPKGRTNNPNGRPKGSKNRANAQVREFLGDFYGKYIEGQYALDWMTLEPRERINQFNQALKYMIPSIRPADIEELTRQDNHLLLDKMSDEQLKELAHKIIEHDGDEYEETTD